MEVFNGVPDSFIKLLCRSVKPAIFREGDFIFRKLEVGTDIYFIHRGERMRVCKCT